MNVTGIRHSQPQQTILKKAAKPGNEGEFEKHLQGAAPRSAATQEANIKAMEKEAILSRTEKEYFAQLFPEATQEVHSYNPYRRDPSTAVVKLGTIVDRKG